MDAHCTASSQAAATLGCVAAVGLGREYGPAFHHLHHANACSPAHAPGLPYCFTAKELGERLRDRNRISPFFGHRERCFDVAFDPTGALLASASEDGTVRIWDVESCTTLLTLRHESEVLRVGWAHGRIPGRLLLASASAAGKVRLWDVQTNAAPAVPGVDARGGGRVPPQVRASVTRELPHGESEQIYACKFVEDTLLTASDDCVHFWDVETGIKSAMWRYEHLPGLKTNPFGGEARNPNGQAYVFDVEVGTLGFSGREVVCVALSDGSVRVKDRRTSASVATLSRTGAGHTTNLKLNDEAGVLVSCSGKGEATVWDTRKWTIRSTLRGHTGPVYGASFAHTAPGGGAGPLLTWSSDGRLNLWEVEEATGTVEPLDTLAYSGFAVYGAAFSPLGERLACAGGASNDCCNSHGHPRTLVVHRLGPSP